MAGGLGRDVPRGAVAATTPNTNPPPHTPPPPRPPRPPPPPPAPPPICCLAIIGRGSCRRSARCRRSRPDTGGCGEIAARARQRAESSSFQGHSQASFPDINQPAEQRRRSVAHKTVSSPRGFLLRRAAAWRGRAPRAGRWRGRHQRLAVEIRAGAHRLSRLRFVLWSGIAARRRWPARCRRSRARRRRAARADPRFRGGFDAYRLRQYDDPARTSRRP